MEKIDNNIGKSSNSVEKIYTNIDIIGYFKKDWVVIFIFLFAIFACLYTMLTVGAYQEAINQKWQQQWDASGCEVKPYLPNVTFKIGGSYNEIED